MQKGGWVEASMLTESKLEDHLKEEILKQMGAVASDLSGRVDQS